MLCCWISSAGKFCVLIDAFRALLKLQTLFVRGRGSFHLNPIHVEDIEHKHYYIHPKLCVFLFMPQRLRTTGVSLQVIRMPFRSRRWRCPPWNWTSTRARKWSSSSGSATAKTPTSSPSRLTGSGIFPVVQKPKLEKRKIKMSFCFLTAALWESRIRIMPCTCWLSCTTSPGWVADIHCSFLKDVQMGGLFSFPLFLCFCRRKNRLEKIA